MAYPNDTTIPHCDSQVTSYVKNLTDSFTDRSDEIGVAFTSIAMFILAATFFSLNLFSRSPDISATIQPTVRTFLSVALVLFDPVMSYLFSEAKNAAAVTSSYDPAAPSRTGSGGPDELSSRARMILTWVLLVLLLRKKVEGFQVAAEWPENLGVILRQASPVLWPGYLVFVTLKSAGRKAVFGTLWLLGAIKFIQRVITNELGKHSLASGKNARLVSSYMNEVLHNEDGQITGSELQPLQLLKNCEFVVMGEEHLVKDEEAGPHGYLIDIDDPEKQGKVVTVGKVWKAFSDPSTGQATREEPNRGNNNNPNLKIETDPRQLCLSFALYKLLRRRIEHLPAMSKSETDKCRKLIFQGLCKTVEKPETALFQVMTDEINFVTEYYHSVFPVVHASLRFFLVNYIMVPFIILCLSLMVIILCGNGNVIFAFKSIQTDNYAISIGVFKLTSCLVRSVFKSPQMFFATMELTITFILMITFLYEQVWEFIIFLLSNWFTVSLICSHTSKYHQSGSSQIHRVVPTFMWLRKQLSHPGLVEMKQFSVLSFCRLSLFTRSKPMPREAKWRIMELLTMYGQCSGNPLNKGLYTLELESNREFSNLSWACRSDSVAEVILTWHVATGLLEISHSQQRCHPNSARDVATSLSRYCAYLVASHPKLLPDDHEGTKHIYKQMKKDMREKLGKCIYYLSTEQTRSKKLMKIANHHGRDAATGSMKIFEKGAVLGKTLIDKAGGSTKTQDEVWNLLCDLWTELIIYVSPSSGDEHDMGHKSALATGGGLITLLWALTTHTGITRPPRTHIPTQHSEMISGSPRQESA